MWIDGPDGGYGISHYYQNITFSSGATQASTYETGKRPVPHSLVNDLMEWYHLR